jgi:hypothetical protein
MPVITLTTDFGQQDGFVGTMKGVILGICPAAQIVDITHDIIGSEDIIDAMDLRAFGVGPRTWLEELRYRTRDRILIVFGVLLLAASFTLLMLGYGSFWVPEALIRLAGG